MRHILLAMIAILLLACGADITDPQAGYFEDNDNTNTLINNGTIINTNESNSDSKNTVRAEHSSLPYLHDTVLVVDTVIYRDTVSFKDTLVITTVFLDTINQITHDTVQTVVTDTVRAIHWMHDTVSTTILDTITILDTVVQTKFDTITEIKTVVDTVRLLKRDTVTLADTTFLAELKEKFSSLPKYTKIAKIDEDWNITLRREQIRISNGNRYDTYLSLHRNEGSPDYSGRVQVHYIGLPRANNGNAHYTWYNANYKDTTALVDVRYSIDNAGALITDPKNGYTNRQPTLYDNCLIVTELRECTSEACLKTSMYQTVSASETAFDKILWQGEKKICNQ